MSEISFLFLTFFVLCSLSLLRADEVPVQTNAGEIIGFTGSAVFNGTSKDLTRFLGIPFAKPPTGYRRFRKPVPKEKFTSPFNASVEGPACLQDPSFVDKNLKTSEDCLSLNIYVPRLLGNGSDVNQSSVPVMVWIYGGGFIMGATTYYDGSILSAFNDVIVVTVNYRVSVLGFLATGDSAARGNYGLWDQHLALKWVNSNIGSFGGDPGNVTIFGESAGSASVIYQALYPGNKGLFQRVIGQSGTPLSPWAFTHITGATGRNLNLFASHVHCSNFRLSSVVNCLRTKPVTDIMNKNNFQDVNFPNSGIRGNFIPVIDGEFLSISPELIFKGADSKSKMPIEFFKSLDIMMGVNSMDGADTLFLYRDVCMPKSNETQEFTCDSSVVENEIIPVVTKELFFDTITLLNKAVNFEYSDWSSPDDKNRTRDLLIDFTTDYTFFIPIVRTLDSHAQSNTTATYFYQFSHRPSYDKSPDWMSGAIHAMDLPFTFGFPDSLAILGYNGSVITDEEIALSHRMMKLLTNFAKFGNPNVQATGKEVWPRLNSTARPYLNLDTTMTNSVRHGLHADRVSFWLGLVPAILNATGHSPGELPDSTNIGIIGVG